MTAVQPRAMSPWRLSVAPMLDSCESSTSMRLSGCPCAAFVHTFLPFSFSLLQFLQQIGATA